MSRTFKGYAVRDDEGRWLGHVFNEDSITTVYGDKANRRLWEDAEDAQDAARHDVLSINGFVVVPVFAVPKRRTLTDIPPEVLPEDDDPRDTGTRAEAEAVVARIPGAKLVRILDDGAHEAGVEAARREERERIYKLIDDADDDDTEVSEGLKYALLLMRQNGGSK